MRIVGTVHDHDFGDVVLGACGPVLVHVHAGQRGHDDELTRVLESLATELPWLAFVRLDAEQDPVTSAAYRVSQLPALLVFDAGEPRLSIIGTRPFGRLRELLETLAPPGPA